MSDASCVPLEAVETVIAEGYDEAAVEAVVADIERFSYRVLSEERAIEVIKENLPDPD